MINQKIAEYRKKIGMTQEDLANKLNVSRQSVSKWESGKAYPETDKIIFLAQLFNCPLDELINDREASSQEIKEKSEPVVIKKTFFDGRIWKGLIIFLTILPLLVAICFLPFSPDLLPAHYDASFEVTRWGQKYENLILPITIIIISLGFYWFSNVMVKNINRDHLNVKSSTVKKTMAILLCSLLLIFNSLFFWLHFKGYQLSIDKYGKVVPELPQVVSLYLSLFLTIIGGIMPFSSQNLFFGIRTNLSLQNKEVWKKSHFWGGIIFCLIGTGNIIFNILVSRNEVNFYVLFISMVLAVTITVIHQFYLAKKYKSHLK